MIQKKGKTGRNLQAEAIIADMVQKELIFGYEDGTYSITLKGLRLAAQYRGGAQ